MLCWCFRRVLEMCCFMEKMLASMLADFEMKVEKDVLEPLNKLSEVRMIRTVSPLSGHSGATGHGHGSTSQGQWSD